MTASLLHTLGWLKPAPADFKARLKEAAASGAPGAEFLALASHALGETHLTSLAKAVGRAQAAGVSLKPLETFRLGLIGNGTLNYMEAAIIGSAVRHRFAVSTVRGEYDQVLQEAIAPDSAINTAGLDAVLIALDYRGLPLQCPVGDEDAAQATAARALGYIEAACAGIREHGKATPIVQTLAAPPEPLFGGLDRSAPGTLFDIISRINRGIAETYSGARGVVLDAARLAECVGVAAWFDPTLYNLAKQPFAAEFLPLYADHVARTIGAIRGKSRRVLVLDLDNTVWGGVIGDDGMEGIKLAQGDATGEAHLAVQRYALALRDRGVVLAVSSKNDDAVARRVFREHPEMQLREHHVSVFQANWQDKATNIKAIADELSLGLDSFVFLDDNPLERELVRRTLPAVAVPELPDDPALYGRTLAAAGYFDTLTFSEEDKSRADFYQANARRVALQSQVGDLNAYLDSLDMEISFRPFDATNRARITQLINKSNQFNLTTRRYSEAEVADAEADSSVFTLQVRLTDIFGDNGMISVVICRPDSPDTWRIDSWLMSCRVLMRNVEQMVLRELLMHARARGVQRIIGEFRPTDRNGMVREHYAKLGFDRLAERADGAVEWVMAVPDDAGPAHMRVVRDAFDPELLA
jgi:FkbH-like protein